MDGDEGFDRRRTRRRRISLLVDIALVFGVIVVVAVIGLVVMFLR